MSTRWAAWRRARVRLGVGALAGAAIVAGAVGAGQPSESAGDGRPSWDGTTFRGVSRPSDMRELAFGVRGKVAEVSVEPGDRVSAGQLLVRLNDSVEERSVALARLRAEDTSPLRAAESTLAYRKDEHARTEDSFAKGGAGDSDVRESKYRLDQADLSVESAKADLEEARLGLAREEARLAEMRVVCPIDAVVLDVHKRAGETVDELTKVVTIVATDPLLVDLSIPPRVAMQLRVGQPAEVIWQDVDGVEPSRGSIVFLSPAGHGGARELAVRLEVPNPGGLPSGLHGEVRFLSPSPGGTGGK